MLTVCIRTLVFYVLLTALMRLMGKRQIGELTMPEFVSAILLSELAVLPMTDPDVPLLYGIAPILLIACCEVVVSALCRKSAGFRRLVQGDPIPLVQGGRLIEANCAKARVSKDDIMTTVRCEGYASLNEVSDVTLERTGKMSVLPK